MWDERFNLPVPPVTTVAPSEVAFWTTAIFGGLAALVFLYGLKHWRDSGRPIVLMIMLGGAVTTLVEPFLDVVGAAWHPETGQPMAFELFGRLIPWWVVAAYTFYFGALGSLNFLAFERGVTRRQVWIWFAVPMCIDIVMEELMMHWDLYCYYGQQPLIAFFKFPLWWAPCNSLGEFIGISILALMATSLRGWKLLLIPVILPMADAVGYAAVAMPSWLVVNTEGLPYWIVQLGGVMTFALTALVVHGIALVVAQDSPLKASAAAPAGRAIASS
ncbi:hypothetical protein [Hydrocarboniphaga sp.]|uniref:hypothetical protein n=1 Tax=Hydrocarboniphaga sp. TaxID=2033016 RepID=UPI003D0B7A50